MRRPIDFAIGLPARLAVLRLRNFRNLFIGEAVSLLGDGLFPVALTFGVLDLHHSGTDVGIVLGAFSLPMVLFTLVGEVWSDRLRRKWVMIVSDLVRFVTMAVIAALLLGGRAEVWPGPAGIRLRLRRRLLLSGVYRAHPADRPPDRLQEANALGAWPTASAVRAPFDLGHPRGADRRRRDSRHRRRDLPRKRGLPAHPARAGSAARSPPASLVAELRDGWREVRSRTCSGP